MKTVENGNKINKRHLKQFKTIKLICNSFETIKTHLK